MKLPYSEATSGKRAVEDMKKILNNFGASKFGVMEDFNSGVVTVQFVWRDRQVTIDANAKGYAAAWLKENPWTQKRRRSKADHDQLALKKGNIAVYSILRDWIKGQITAVEVGMLSFEGAFLGQIMLPNGQTVLEQVQKSEILPQIENKTS